MATQPSMFPEIESPDFVRSEEVGDVAETVLRRYGTGTRLTPIAEAVRDDELSILYLVNEKPFNPDTEDEDQPEIAGKCVKAPGLWRDVTGHHVAIWARRFFWDRYDERGREALLLHELLHIEVTHDANGQPKFATRKHDVEDFVDVARQYGPAALAGDGARYVRAAAAFAGDPSPILQPLQDVADATGTEVTIKAGDRSATIKPRKDQALADATAHKLHRVGKAQAAARPAGVTPDERTAGDLICQGADHVPGHTADCPMFGRI